MNLIQFKPVDSEMELLGTAVKILNEFKLMGFTKRDAFVELVLEMDPHYKTFKNMQKLNNFWAGRVKDKFLNSDLEKIIERLKAA
jgi:hypothetical protein